MQGTKHRVCNTEITLFLLGLFLGMGAEKNENHKKVFTLHRNNSTHCNTTIYQREDLLQVFTSLHRSSRQSKLFQLEDNLNQKMIRRDEGWRDVKSCVNSSHIYHTIYQCIKLHLWRVKTFFENLQKGNTSKHPNTSYFHHNLHKYSRLYTWRDASTLHNTS